MAEEMMRLPGATTIGVVGRDGVVLGSEKRVSYGYFVLSKAGKKVFKITDSIGAACAGLVSDMQILIREVGAYSALYQLESNRPISVKSAAKVMATLLFQRRLFPLFTQTIVGGVDMAGPSIYILDPLGSLIPDKFASVGSGAEIAMGILESDYKDGMTMTEARNLVIRAVKSATARDVASGNGLDLLLITKNESKEENIQL
jgi:proteasome beta subunit